MTHTKSHLWGTVALLVFALAWFGNEDSRAALHAQDAQKFGIALGTGSVPPAVAGGSAIWIQNLT